MNAPGPPTFPAETKSIETDAYRRLADEAVQQQTLGLDDSRLNYTPLSIYTFCSYSPADNER